VTIGRQVSIATRVTIVGSSHRFTDPTQPIRNQGMEALPVTISDDVWIGAGAVILGNVCIGEGAVIGAGAVVTRNVPSRALVVGVPARQIGARR